MSTGAWLLVFWTITFAAWLLVHVIALVGVIGSKEIPERQKWVSLLPPATPIVAWRHGHRVSSVLWAAFGVLYVVLRAME